jgi:hypothetical protein
MKVHFYTPKTPRPVGKPVEHRFLFVETFALLMTGQTFTSAGRSYQVTEMEWINQKAGTLKAVCIEVPATAGNILNTDNTRLKYEKF